MVLFILFVAILNLALGYGLALYLHGETYIWPGGWSFAIALKRFYPFIKEPDDEPEEASSVTGATNRRISPTPAGASPTSADELSGKSSRVTNVNALQSAEDELDERLVIDQQAAIEDSAKPFGETNGIDVKEAALAIEGRKAR